MNPLHYLACTFMPRAMERFKLSIAIAGTTDSAKARRPDAGRLRMSWGQARGLAHPLKPHCPRSFRARRTTVASMVGTGASGAGHWGRSSTISGVIGRPAQPSRSWACWRIAGNFWAALKYGWLLIELGITDKLSMKGFGCRNISGMSVFGSLEISKMTALPF